MMNEDRICGECIYHCYDREKNDWYCANPESEYKDDFTAYGDECLEWEERP